MVVVAILFAKPVEYFYKYLREDIILPLFLSVVLTEKVLHLQHLSEIKRQEAETPYLQSCHRMS